MADLRISVSIGLVIAIVAGEILSAVWFSDSGPWGRWGDRYFISSIVCDIGLGLLLNMIVGEYWSIRKWEDAAMLALWIGLAYCCLEGPHRIHNHRSFTNFFFHALHKCVLVFVMTICMWHFKDY